MSYKKQEIQTKRIFSIDKPNKYIFDARIIYEMFLILRNCIKLGLIEGKVVKKYLESTSLMKEDQFKNTLEIYENNLFKRNDYLYESIIQYIYAKILLNSEDLGSVANYLKLDTI